MRNAASLAGVRSSASPSSLVRACSLNRTRTGRHCTLDHWGRHSRAAPTGKTSVNHPLCSLLALAVGLSGCGSGSAPPPPAASDFSITVSPSSVSIGQGGVTTPVTVTVTASHGFAGTIEVQLQKVPAGVVPLPAATWSMAPDASQEISFTVAPLAVAGSFSVTVAAISGALSHSIEIGLTVVPMPTIETADTGTLLTLTTKTATETARVKLLKAWGGSVVEVSLNGTNYVNSDDPGRGIQTSLWDGNANYTSSWGYNAIEAGDHWFHGSPLVDSTLMSDSIYTKTQPIQWAPENFGGGTDPVAGDAYIEKWISVVPGYNRVFRIHYKITHFGIDTHAQNTQELPVAYVNPTIPHFLYYGEGAPWTNAALTTLDVQGPCCGHVRTPEKWAAYVDDTNTGLALYTPSQYPQTQVFNAGVTLQITPQCPFTWSPGAVLEFDTYVLVGPVDESRSAIYALHSQHSDPSPLAPWTWRDAPAPDDIVRATATVSGWVWGLSPVTSVEVLVDGSKVATATLGLARPDVLDTFPDAPPDSGFQASWDTTNFSNGVHSLVVRATNAVGAVAITPTVQITISN